MKKTLIRILTSGLLVLLASADLHAAGNLLTNPGAEAGDASGWTNVVNGGNGWAFN